MGRPTKPSGGFLDAWQQLVGSWTPPAPSGLGRPPRVSVGELLSALTYHSLQGTGTLSQHFAHLFAAPLADSSWSERRQRLPWELFVDLMRRVLHPRAHRRRHRDAFWQDWRLVALDGTQFSLTNTPQVLATFVKARTRRGRAAFAKITTAVLLEVGWHNPIAAGIGRTGESEWALGLRLIADLPARVLLLADRLYGVPAFLVHALDRCHQVGSHLLIRVRPDVKARTVRRYADGSRLVRVALRAPGRPALIVRRVEVREIRVQVIRRGARCHLLRLWTTLEPDAAPAIALAELYARRWEHELYFRHVKRQLRRSVLLQSHTPDTAAQEVAALILATALIAAERARVATGQASVLCISFAAVLDVTRAMWFTLQMADHGLPRRHVEHLLRQADRAAARCITRKRPGRQCPRALRQPIRAWPRLVQPRSSVAPVTFRVA